MQGSGSCPQSRAPAWFSGPLARHCTNSAGRYAECGVHLLSHGKEIKSFKSELDGNISILHEECPSFLNVLW